MKRTTYGLRRASSASAGHLLLGEAPDRDAVDLDRAQLRVALGLLEPGEHASSASRRVISAKRTCESESSETFRRRQPGLDERPGQAVEQDAVRRQREVVDAGDRGEHPDEDGQVAADERLAAGQPHLVDAHRGEHADEPLDLLEAQHLVAAAATRAPRPACSSVQRKLHLSVTETRTLLISRPQESRAAPRRGA